MGKGLSASPHVGANVYSTSTNCLDRRPLFVLCSQHRWMAAREMSADGRPFRLEKGEPKG